MNTLTTEKITSRYTLIIEGKEFTWNEETITAAQIAQLGGWDLAQGFIEIDKDNIERTVSPEEVIKVKPGVGFGKKHRWKRG